jgi:hypothetical protein
MVKAIFSGVTLLQQIDERLNQLAIDQASHGFSTATWVPERSFTFRETIVKL